MTTPDTIAGCSCAPNEFGIAACDLPAHCEHSSRTCDAFGRWVCDACGHTTPSGPSSDAATAPGPVQGLPSGGIDHP